MKSFLNKKGVGYWCSLFALVLSVLGLLFFRMLTAVSVEQSEHPLLVAAFAFGTILFSLLTTYKDYGKVPSLAAYAFATATFFAALEGRVSYLAFYFSGDVLNTGLSPFLVLALVCFCLAMVAALLGLLCRQEKAEPVRLEKADWKVVIPMIVLVGALFAVVAVNTRSDKIESSVSDKSAVQTVAQTEAAEPVAQQEAEPVPESRYKKPNTSEEVWQEYSGENYLKESTEGKAIAYQLVGHIEIPVPDPTPFDALLNLYENGEAVMTVYGMGNHYTYFGYWTNENDEKLMLVIAHYTVEGQDKTCTIDYVYDLTGEFDTFTANIALGFADGGQYIREIPIEGEGKVKYATPEDFLIEKGWTKPANYKTPTEAEDKWQSYTGADFMNESVSDKAIAYQLTGHTEIPIPDPSPFEALVNLYEDGEAVVTIYGMGRPYQYFGYWTNEGDDHLWFCVMHYAIISMSDDTCTIDYSYDLTGRFDEFTYNLALGFANGGQYIREIPISGDGKVVYASIDEWLKGFGWENPNAEGTEVTQSEAEANEPAEPKEVLFSFTSDSENYLLDINKDGTYTFTFMTAGLVETGTWEWKGWNLTLTDANGRVMEAAKDSSYAMQLHFVAAVDERVNRDFTVDATTWGTAFNGQGNYPAE